MTSLKLLLRSFKMGIIINKINVTVNCHLIEKIGGSGRRIVLQKSVHGDLGN